MVDILFFVDFEEGHVFPTIKMAENLKEQGYSVAYMGIADTMKMVAKAGFETYPILEDIYPEGSIGKRLDQQAVSHESIKKHTSFLLSGGLDELLDRLRPQVIFTSFFLNFEALVFAYRYPIRQVIFWPFLHNLDKIDEKIVGNIPLMTSVACNKRIFTIIDVDVRLQLIAYLKASGVAFGSFEDIVAPLSRLQHIVLCPKELELADAFIDEKVTYLGPGIRNSLSASEEEVKAYLPREKGKKIIFLSMGSQVKSYPEKADTFFRLMMDLMQEPAFSDYHLILAAGPLHGSYPAEALPENVGVYAWVPQTDVLKHTSLAIIHGGLGSIKECIYHGVPMLTIPMGRDQHFNARRVLYHQLGLMLDFEGLTKEGIASKILEIGSSQPIARGIDKMQHLFHEREAEKAECLLVAEIMQKVPG